MKHLSALTLAAMLATLAGTAGLPASIMTPAEPAAPIRRVRVRHDVPFSKRAEGRARRLERRQVRADKSVWLNS